MSRSRLAPFVTLLAALAPVVIVAIIGARHAMMAASVHFGLVSAAAGITCIASLALSVAGARARDGRTVLMGLAFSTMTALFMVHALATPGILAPMNGMIALAGGLSVPVGAGLLALTALPGLRRPGNIRPLVVMQVVVFGSVLTGGLYGLFHPGLVPAVPQAKSSPAVALLLAGAGSLTLLIFRALRTY